jgi:hypothetical protein
MSALALTSLKRACTSEQVFNFCAFAVFLAKTTGVRINYKTSRFKQKQMREKFAMHI